MSRKKIAVSWLSKTSATPPYKKIIPKNFPSLCVQLSRCQHLLMIALPATSEPSFCQNCSITYLYFYANILVSVHASYILQTMFYFNNISFINHVKVV